MELGLGLALFLCHRICLYIKINLKGDIKRKLMGDIKANLKENIQVLIIQDRLRLSLKSTSIPIKVNRDILR